MFFMPMVGLLIKDNYVGLRPFSAIASFLSDRLCYKDTLTMHDVLFTQRITLIARLKVV